MWYLTPGVTVELQLNTFTPFQTFKQTNVKSSKYTQKNTEKDRDNIYFVSFQNIHHENQTRLPVQ